MSQKRMIVILGTTNGFELGKVVKKMVNRKSTIFLPCPNCLDSLKKIIEEYANTDMYFAPQRIPKGIKRAIRKDPIFGSFLLCYGVNIGFLRKRQYSNTLYEAVIVYTRTTQLPQPTTHAQKKKEVIRIPYQQRRRAVS